MDKKIKDKTGKEHTIYDGEFVVELMTGLGIHLGCIIMKEVMKEALIKSYFEGGVVRSYYLYINGKEITDGKNYNPYKGV